MLLFVLGHLNSYHSCSRMFASTRISSLVNNTACFNNKKLSLLHSNRSRFGPWKNSMTTFLLNLIYVGIIRYLIKRIFIQLDDDVTYDWNEFTSSIFSIQVGLSFLYINLIASRILYSIFLRNDNMALWFAHDLTCGCILIVAFSILFLKILISKWPWLCINFDSKCVFAK